MSGAALADRFLFRCGSQSPPPAFALQELPREKQWEANNERLRRVPARIRPAALRALPRPETFTQPSWAEPHSAPSTSKERERDPTASPALLRNRDKTRLKEAWP